MTEMETGRNVLKHIVGVLDKSVSYKLLIPLVLMASVAFIAPHFWPKGQPQLPPTQSDDQGIKKLIEEVKKELTEASDDMERNHETALFKLKSFDLEVTFVVQSNAMNSADAKYELVTVNNKLETSSGRTQKLTLHMDVVPPAAKSQSVVVGPSADLPGEITNEGAIPPEGPKSPTKGHHQ